MKILLIAITTMLIGCAGQNTKVTKIDVTDIEACASDLAIWAADHRLNGFPLLLGWGETNTTKMNYGMLYPQPYVYTCGFSKNNKFHTIKVTKLPTFTAYRNAIMKGRRLHKKQFRINEQCFYGGC